MKRQFLSTKLSGIYVLHASYTLPFCSLLFILTLLCVMTITSFVCNKHQLKYLPLFSNTFEIQLEVFFQVNGIWHDGASGDCVPSSLVASYQCERVKS